MFRLPKMTLGERISYYRRKAGWTLEQLSDRCGVDVGTISALENRRSLRSKYAVAIANAFGLSADQLEDPVADFDVPLPHAEPAPKYVDLPAGIRGERRVPLLTWGDLRDDKKMLNCTTHSGPTAVAPGDNVADNAFAVAYDSDAFLADIPRSATLIINPGTTWETGRLALMECSGAIVLRRLAMDGERSMLIAHDAANWNATPLNPMSDRIIGLVACAYKNF